LRVALDVLELIDELDLLVSEARAVPLTEQMRVSQEELYRLLDSIRERAPEQIVRARFVVREQTELLAQAQREAERLYQRTLDEAAELTSEREIARLAQQQADDILARARWQAERRLLRADDWIESVLAGLELNLEMFLRAIRRGRESLHERSQETAIRHHVREKRAA
jgi:hypothetical protein